MPRNLALTLALAAGTLTPAHALAKPAPPTQEVIANRVQQQLRAALIPPSQAELDAAIQPVDINGDGIQDWQVAWKHFGADWCGIGGCRFQLWLGRAKGKPQRVFDRQIRALTIALREGRAVFIFDFHGGECSGFGSQACPGEFAWDPAAKRLRLLPTPALHTAVEEPLVFKD